MNKVVFIVGPTAVGKTQLALDLAHDVGGEIVCADSVQVYRHLDIISGKDLPPDYKLHAGHYISNSSAPIHLLDVVDPTTSFTVFDFQTLATKAIDSILNNNKLPIVVGGTGLYVKALTDGLEINVKPDLELRKKLESLNISELHELLPKEKVESLNDSDRNNKRRLVRAIEVSRIKNHELRIKNKKGKQFESLVLGLKTDRDALRKRIDSRVEDRLKNGALKEAEGLFENYQNLSQQVKDANGYKQFFRYLKNETTLEEAIYRWKISEYRHAKNQMTWFSKYGNVEWYDMKKVNSKKEIGKRIKSYLS